MLTVADIFEIQSMVKKPPWRQRIKIIQAEANLTMNSEEITLSMKTFDLSIAYIDAFGRAESFGEQRNS